ncbi:TIGR04141 family sporadically distributed protein [Candidatus Phytoplasma pruni]|uniref:TIGR04141 family sporadically distributed protein n=1 Tax=Candidatus Phytoplasma pruni TaxID=479893 RepID=A0A851HK99_9MOLU|nr:TIGR04141 family sporadically distributed protein [Candidatus Phytoplasma pruni]
MEENNIEKILTYFKKYKIILTNETETSENQIEKTVWETLLFQCDIENSEKPFYYLYNGVWYNYDNNFIQRLNDNLSKKQIDEATFPVFFKKQVLTETQYNKETTKHLNENSTNSSLYFNLDTKTASIKQDTNNRSSLEPCDILEINYQQKHVFLHFVKVGTSTQKFSHLCRQGVNSAYCFTNSPEGREKLKTLLYHKDLNDVFAKHNLHKEDILNFLLTKMQKKEIKIVYHIVTNKTKIKELTIFNKLSLQDAFKDLKNIEVRYEFEMVLKENEEEK